MNAPNQNRSPDIESLERQYWEAMRSHDVKSAVELTAFPCLIVGAQGSRAVERDEYVSLMKSTPMQIDSFDLHGAMVKFLTDDVAVINYELSQVSTHDGKQTSKTCIDSSTWVKQGESWKCAAHAEVPKQAPAKG